MRDTLNTYKEISCRTTKYKNCFLPGAVPIWNNIGLIWNNIVRIWNNIGLIWNNIVRIWNNIVRIWNNIVLIWNNIVRIWNNIVRIWNNIVLIWNNIVRIWNNIVLIWNNIGTDFQTCTSLNKFKRHLLYLLFAQTQKLSSVFMIQQVLDTSPFFVSK